MRDVGSAQVVTPTKDCCWAAGHARDGAVGQEMGQSRPREASHELVTWPPPCSALREQQVQPQDKSTLSAHEAGEGEILQPVSAVALELCYQQK